MPKTKNKRGTLGPSAPCERASSPVPSEADTCDINTGKDSEEYSDISAAAGEQHLRGQQDRAVTAHRELGTLPKAQERRVRQNSMMPQLVLSDRFTSFDLFDLFAVRYHNMMSFMEL